MYQNKLKRAVKNALILGDSYSTFAGYIPSGYAAYYSSADSEKTDVRHVEETWWHILSKKANVNIILNNSWSGSTVGYTGYGNSDCSSTSSFIHRFDELYDNGFFEKNDIDTVFVFGGTNDSWANVELGEPFLDEWKTSDLFRVLPAITYVIYNIRKTLPNVNVVFIINTDIKEQIGCAVKAASEKFDTSYVELKNISKNCGHPTIQGMKEIAEQVLEYINLNTP